MISWKVVTLGSIAKYSNKRICSDNLKKNNYISTDNMLQNKGGITESSVVPKGNVIQYRRGQTLISNIRPYFKKIWFAEHDGGCSADVLVLDSIDEIDDEYFYYYLSQDSFFDYVMAGTKGTKMPRGDKDHILKFEFKYPSILEQKSIAETLTCIDEKIKVNNKINKNLEEMAQAIYKSWFVEFEPFQDGEFEESELGRIPKGWIIKPLREIIKKNKEKINKFEDWKNELIIDLSNMPQFSMSINQFDKGEKFSTNIYKLNKYDILFGSIRSYFGKAGFSPIDGVVTGTVHSYSPLFNEDFSYVLMLTTSRPFIDYTIVVSTGTKMPIVNWESFCKYNCIYPNSKLILSEFNYLIFPIIKKIENNILENQKLISLRDSLLPKLMSGEIRIHKEEE